MTPESTPAQDLYHELELLENLSDSDIQYVLSHNDSSPFAEVECPSLTQEDIIAIKTRAAILLNTGYPQLLGGDAVCQATKERIEIRDQLTTGQYAAVNEADGMVHVVGGADRRSAMNNAMGDIGRA